MKLTDSRNIVAGAIALTGLCAMPAIAADLTLELSGISSEEGMIRVAVYNNEADFTGKRVFRAMALRPLPDAMPVRITDLPAGQYAIMLFHDLNGNEKLDTNLLGIPSEPWSASLLGRSVFGAPTWSDVEFTLDAADKLVQIGLE